MPLVTLREVLAGSAGSGAVGAFSTYDLYTAQGIIAGAERVGLPVIAMLGAAVLARPGNEQVGEIMVSLARRAAVPVVVLLDHARDLVTCVRAIRLGFSAVMIDGSHLPLEDNIALTCRVKQVADAVGVSVEAELGALAGVEDGEEVRHGKMTNPAQVREFCAATAVDALAVSIGNAHGFYKGCPNLNFDLLAELARVSTAPLVLHGGTGLEPLQFARAVQYGIKKINIGTEVKKTYIDTFIERQMAAPAAYDLIGLPQACKEAVAELVAGKLRFFHSGWRQLME
ncbi:MAG: class II fructose-bisphosphate aldolase [Desulfurispora sp.]|uniref:class II fructose-bisphosphate aldolase n=1 Tax=Desulfurispora sp. TaxID=3014275 RepID=UPI0040494094